MVVVGVGVVVVLVIWGWLVSLRCGGGDCSLFFPSIFYFSFVLLISFLILFFYLILLFSFSYKHCKCFYSIFGFLLLLFFLFLLLLATKGTVFYFILHLLSSCIFIFSAYFRGPLLLKRITVNVCLCSLLIFSFLFSSASSVSSVTSTASKLGTVIINVLFMRVFRKATVDCQLVCVTSGRE